MRNTFKLLALAVALCSQAWGQIPTDLPPATAVATNDIFIITTGTGLVTKRATANLIANMVGVVGLTASNAIPLLNGTGTNTVFRPSNGSNVIAFTVQGFTNQATNLFEWKDYAGVLMGSINSNGFIGIGTNTARFPLDITASPNQTFGTAYAAAQFANDLDTNLWVRFKAGKTANHRRYLAFMKYDESTWDALLGVNESNTLIYYDAPFGTHRMAIASGGISQLNSVGTAGVYINREFSGDPGTGTGGLHVYGGSYPSTFLYHLGTNYFYSAPHVWWSVGQSVARSRFEIVGTSTNTDANFYDGDVTLGILNKSTNVNTVSSLTFEALDTAFSVFPVARIAADRTSHTIGNLAGGLNFQTATNSVTSTVMGLTGDKTVYIGPSNSIAPLTVSKSYVNPAGGINSTGTVAIFANNNVASGNAAISILARTSGNSGINFGNDSAEATHQIRSGFAAGTPYNGAIAFLPSGTEQARVDSNGVGIGTGTNRIAKLEVIGTGNTYLLSINTNNFVVTNSMVGIGTSAPNATLHINGTFKLVDGSQGASKLLTSDANGLASWATAPTSGESNTLANIGTGLGLAGGKTGVVNYIKSVAPGNAYLDVATNSGTMTLTPTNLATLDSEQRVTGRKTLDNSGSAVHELGNIGATNTVSWVTNDFSLTATNTVTLLFSGSPPSSGDRFTRTVWYTQYTNGGNGFVVGTNIVSVDPTANATTVVWITTLDGGTTLYAASSYSIIGTSGTGHSLFAGNTNGQNWLKSLDAGANITLTPTTNGITIASTGAASGGTNSIRFALGQGYLPTNSPAAFDKGSNYVQRILFDDSVVQEVRFHYEQLPEDYSTNAYLLFSTSMLAGAANSTNVWGVQTQVIPPGGNLDTDNFSTMTTTNQIIPTGSTLTNFTMLLNIAANPRDYLRIRITREGTNNQASVNGKAAIRGLSMIYTKR